MLFSRLFLWINLGLFVFLLSACASRDMNDLETFIADTWKRENPHVDPIPPFKLVQSHFYEVGNMRDPFKPLIEKTAIAGPDPDGVNPEQPTNCLRPDTNRVRVGLERMPLDALKMVGTLEEQGIQWGLVIEKSDFTIHRVKTGDYIGENYGQIINISENKIEVLELQPDAKGCFSEQAVTMALYEDTTKK